MNFEEEYLSIRKKEGRIYSDDVVRQLPFVDSEEWRIRRRSAERLLNQLKKEKCRSFTEIGCGNGWLTRYLQRELKVEASGIDINRPELEQAQRLSAGAKFICGDILSHELKRFRSGTIIFAASIQYFPDFTTLIDSLMGTIHIIDSPFYKDATEARKRSEKYFASMDSNMKPYYFHHELKDLEKYDHEYLYRPTRIKRFLGGTPFPYIRIRKG